MHQRDSWASYSIRKIFIYSIFFIFSVIILGLCTQVYEGFRFRRFSEQIEGYLSDQKIHKFALEIQSEKSMNFPFELYVILDGKKKEVAYQVGNDVDGLSENRIPFTELIKERNELGREVYEEEVIEFLKKQLGNGQIQILNPIWENKISIAMKYQINETWIYLFLHELYNE